MTKTMQTWANQISGQFEKDIQNFIGCFSEYLENASLAEPDSKGRMPWDLDFQYLINNIAQAAHQQAYGNTTDLNGNPDPRANLQNDYWKAVHVKARADKALADYIHNRPELHEDNPRTFDPDAALEDMKYLGLKTTAEAAEKRMDALRSLQFAFVNLFQSLFEEVWTYKPFTVKTEAMPRTQTAQQQQIADRLRAMKNRNSEAA
jgi:hypothetical protein